MIELLGESREELRARCAELGEPAYRGDQIYRALYAEKNLDLSSISTLPAAFREKLAQSAAITLPVVKHKYQSQDGSVRYLFGLSAQDAEVSGNARPVRPASVEAVFMPSENRQTICIST